MKNDIKRLIEVAAGREKADLVLKNAQIVNVFTQEIIRGDVAVCGEKIAGIGNYDGQEEVDATGLFVVPGLIDAHVHMESSMVTPFQFARAVVPRGTTTIIADPHEIANVLGLEGIGWMIEQSRDLPLDVHFMFPSCVPATAFESAGANLNAEAVEGHIHDQGILGLGEMMDYTAVAAGDEEALRKIAAAQGMVRDGHAPGLTGKSLNTYTASGIYTDHECSTVEEMREKLRLGFHILIREGSAARDLEALIRGVDENNMRRCMFCTDDRHLEDILRFGHIDNHIRTAVNSGFDPVSAITMATLNAAECYRLYDRGAIAPGFLADLLLVDDLTAFNIKKVFKRGKLAAAEGKYLLDPPGRPAIETVNTVHIGDITEQMLQLKMDSEEANVIRLQPGRLVTRKVRRKVAVKNGVFEYSPAGEIVKLAVIERHKGTGRIGLGLLENFPVRNGAIGMTIAHDSHNLIVAGDNDRDMLAAIRELTAQGGGITIASGGRVLKTLPLPIAGLLSDKSYEEVNSLLAEMLETAYGLGLGKDTEPFISLSFLALPVIPEIKLTDRGLFDVERNAFITVSFIQ